MIENNIIQSLGAGSGINSSNIVKQLTEIERAAPQQRITTKIEEAESQISDFGLLASAMDTLKSAVAVLSDEEGMYSKTGSISDTSSLQVTADPDATTGSYALQVQSLAQSHNIAFEVYDSKTDSVGEGTLTFSFGSWDRDTDGFTADADSDSVDIVIDSSNNSLEGLRDAINEADMGVQASILDVGDGFRLILSAESGAEKELYIEATDDDGDNLDDGGLSRFAFNENLTVNTYSDLETQEGKDAVLSINGVAVTRSSNSIDDAVDGLTFDLLQIDTDETISLTISDDKAYAETNVRNFVDAYNAFLEEIDPLFSFNEEEEKWGSLRNDSLAKSVVSQFRSVIASEITGLSDGNYTALTNVGIRTELDGTLSIDEDDFADAFSENFEDVQRLFAPYKSSSASYLEVYSYAGNTVAGEYDVIISQAPTKGTLTTDVEATPVLDATARTYSFVVTLDDDNESAEITLDTSVAFGSTDELVAALQTAINADDTLSDAGSSLIVSYDTDTNQFVFTSDKYGSDSSVRFSDMSTDFMEDFGMDTDSGDVVDIDDGNDVAGTIDGVAGFGYGQVLRPALDEDAQGLSMIISESATTGETVTVSFSRGFAGSLEEVLDNFLETNGLFDARGAVLTTRIENLEEDQENLDRRMSAYEERLMRQFVAMENILNGLNSQGGFLENLSKTLPFTSGND